MGMKVSEEQYDKYGQILQQFLEDIFTEDTKGNILWFKAKRFKNLLELKAFEAKFPIVHSACPP